MKIIDKRKLEELKSRDKVLLQCYRCGKEFSKSKNQIQSVLNGSKKTKLKYCSKLCGILNRKNGEYINCKFCNKPTYKVLSEIKENNFCSRSCSVSFKNINKEKKKYLCSRCGGPKSKQAQFCFNCKKLNTLENNLNKRLGDCLCDGHARTKFAKVRKIAHDVLILMTDREKICEICGFDIAVEVCHIRPLPSFKLDCLLKEVNSIDNLIYLCPNHHKMLDRDFLSIIEHVKSS